MKKNKAINKDLKKYFSKVKKNEKIILYGYGTWGKIFEEYIVTYRKDLEIIHIIDNNLSKINEKSIYSNLSILSFQDYLDLHLNHLIIITIDREKPFQEILTQLNKNKCNFHNIMFKKEPINSIKPTHNLFYLLISPLIQIITNIYFLFVSLYSLKVLFKGQWSKYSRFNVQRSFNSAAHRLYDPNIEKYSRSGYSFLNGLGFPMESRFYLTKLSNLIYSRMESIIPVFGVYTSLLLLIFLFHQNTNNILFFISTYIILMSSLAYYNAFEAMKYDALGWIFYPLLIYALVYKIYILFFLTLIILMITSISVFIPSVLIAIILGLIDFDITIFILIFMVGLLFLTKFKYLLVSIKDLSSLLDQIGFTSKGKNRRKHIFKFNFKKAYILIFHIIILGYLIISGQPVINILLLSITLFLYIVNFFIARFADDQTLEMFILINCSIILISSNNWYLLLLTLFLISPSSRLLNFVGERKLNHFLLPKRKVFNIYPAHQKLKKVFNDINPYERILFVYNYKKGQYPNFDGYRAIKELINEVLFKKDAILLPDFYLFNSHFANKFNIDLIYGNNTKKDLFEGAKILGSQYFLLPENYPLVNDFKNSNELSYISSLDIKELINDDDTGIDHLFPQNFSKLYLFKVNFPINILTTGTLIEIEPNFLKLQTNVHGICTIKFLYDKGWKTREDYASVNKDEYGYIQVQSKPNTIINLYYNYYG